MPSPWGIVALGDDCDDTNSDNYPGNTEICDGADQNCDGKDNNCDLIIDAGSCPANASCADAGGTVDAVCSRNGGYIEDPDSPGTCVEGIYPQTNSIFINEIMIEPASVAAADGQYFELKNAVDATILISGMELVVDGIAYTIPQLTGQNSPPR